MWFKILITLLIFKTIISATYSNINFQSLKCGQASNKTIILLHVVFRHGDRTTEVFSVYPKDPHKNETYYPYGYGELTNAGKQKEYAIGTALRNTYDTFLGDYFPDVLEARSTDYNRTKASLQLLLAALYKPRGELIWNPELAWQPIPFVFSKFVEDHLMGYAASNCPKYMTAYQTYLNSPEVLETLEEHKEFFAYLSENTGWNVQNFEQAAVIYFCLLSETEWGLKLPIWANEIWPDQLEKSVMQFYLSNYATPELRKLSAGSFLKKIVDDTQAKIDNVLYSNKKIFLYSGHEYNIASTLSILGLYFPHVPPYGSYITMEIHNISNTLGIQILYQDYTSSEPKLLQLPGCSKFCPWDKFKSLMEYYLSTQGDTC